MEMVEHGTRGTTGETRGRVAIERVLAHVEIEGREIGGAEGVDGGRDPDPVMGLDGAGDRLAQFGEPVQDEAFELGHGRELHALGLDEAVERAEQPAQRVAQPAVELGLLAEDLGSDPDVLPQIRPHRPEAQDVGAVLVAHLLGADSVTERLAHLAAQLVERESVADDGAERGPGASADRLQQARLEPAAMLVGALEVDIGGPGQAARLEHEGVGAAALEPDVDDVAHLLVLVGVAVVAEEAAGGRRIPGIRALLAEDADDPGHHLGVPQNLAGPTIDEHRDRHAPRALPRDAPVRAVGEHAVEPMAALRRHEDDRLQRLDAACAQAIRAVEADEPLRRRAIDKRRPRSPGMRVGVGDGAAREQGGRLGERAADRIGRLEDVQPAPARHPVGVAAVGTDGLGHLEPVGDAEREILLAVAGRDVDETGALVGGDEVAGEQRDVVLVAVAAQRMGGDAAGERGRWHNPLDLPGGDARVRRDPFHEGAGDQQPLADARGRAFVDRIDADEGVVDGGAVGDGAVAGNGPGGGGPDHHRRLGRGQRAGDEREAHPDGGAEVVVVLDLGLGESGLLDRAPHHRTQPAIEQAVEQEAADLGGDGGLGGEVHRRVARVPLALDAEAAELGILQRQPLLRVGAALGAELEHRDGVLVAAGGAVFLLDLPLDRQAVAVPARDVADAASGHALGAVDDVLVDLVQRVADMQVAVGVGRSVMQHEGRPAGGIRDEAFGEPGFGPVRQDRGLAPGQVGAHRKQRPGQEDGVAVIARVRRDGSGGGGVGHGMHSLSRLICESRT